MIDEELLERIREALDQNNDNAFLIGDTEFDNDDLDDMESYLRTRAAIVKSVTNFSDDEIKIFIVYVVNKLREWDKEWSGPKFWERVNEMFDNDANISKYTNKNQLNERINDILNQSNIKVFVNENSGDRRFAQTFLFQAFSTKKSLQAFIQLAWNLYLNELDCEYPDSDLEFCEYIINKLKSKYSNVDSEVEVEFGGATYDIKAALRYGIFQSKTTVNLLNRIFNYIYRVDNNNEDICDNHLGKLVTDKVNELKKLLPKRNYKRINSWSIKETVSSFDKIRPQFTFSGDESNPHVYLSLPKIRLLYSEAKYEYYNVEIYSNGVKVSKSLEDLSCRAKHNEGMITFIQQDIDITELVKQMKDCFDIEIKIHTNIEDKVYCSKASLNREFLLFKNNREIRGTGRKGIYFLLVPNNFNFSQIHLSDKDNLEQVKSNLFLLSANDGDSIITKKSKVVFGSQKTDQIQIRNNILPLNFAFIIKDDNDIPIYTTFSDLLISLHDDEAPNTIVLRHIFIPYNSTKEKQPIEIRINTLKKEGVRFVLPYHEFKLGYMGYHEIQLCELKENGAKLNACLKYYFDPSTTSSFNNQLMYLNGNFDFDFCFNNKTFNIQTKSEKKEEIIEINNSEKLKIILPFFEWRWGSFYDGIIHPHPINLEKPIFVDDITSSSETIVIDSFFNIKKLVFQSLDDNSIIVLNSKSKDNTEFKFSEFLESNKTNRINGKILAFLEENEKLPIPLFAVTDEPYIIERLLDNCFNYSEKKCEINFSNCFIHDLKYDYRLCLTITNNSSEDTFTIPDFDPNDSIEFENENLIDGEYFVELKWYKLIGGVKGATKEISFEFTEPTIILGNPLLIEFNKIKSLNLTKTKIFINDDLKNIKFKDSTIDNIRFDEYNDVGMLVYKGFLNSKKIKHIEVKFVIKSSSSICQIKKESHNNVDKMLNYDYINGSLTFDELKDQEVYQMYSITCK